MELQKKLQALSGHLPSVNEATRVVTVLEQGALALVMGGQTSATTGGSRPRSGRGGGSTRRR